MDLTQYADIAPYSAERTRQVALYLASKPEIIDRLLGAIIGTPNEKNMPIFMKYRKKIVEDLPKVYNYTDFQKLITAGSFIPALMENSVTEFTFSGQENLVTGEPYLFMSNHRDIILDCTLLDYALLQTGNQLCEMAIGDNLLSNQLAADLLKVNGGITIRRELPMREKYLESIRLSEYFVDLLTEEHRSIWVAQKSGRSKDGIDTTQSGIIKMLYLSKKKSGIKFNELIGRCHIVPVSISYEYDPCDINKGREETMKIRLGSYTKKKYEDVISMLKGLRKFKGRIHLTFGKPLDDSYPDAVAAAKEVDRQIQLNYRLFPTNCFAYDYMEHSDRFSDVYRNFDGDRFLARYSHLDDDVREYVLNAYANPVRSYLAQLDSAD